MKLKKKINIPLDKYINLSLYDKKNGYYMKKNPFGKKSDFITAPNISRLFSEMIAIWIINFWQSLGSPKNFNLIELGAGNGEMMKILIESFKNFPVFFKSCNIFIHEKSPILIKIQKKNLKGNKYLDFKYKKIKKNPTIFIANEFFDAIAIKQFIKIKNSWFERFVNIKNKKKAFFFDKKINMKKIEKKIQFKISQKIKILLNILKTGINYLKIISKIIKKNNGGLFNNRLWIF